MKIIDPTGVWLRNNAQFPLCDPELGYTFEPQVLVKIKHSAWAKGQKVIALMPDPLAPVVVPSLKKVSPV